MSDIPPELQPDSPEDYERHCQLEPTSLADEMFRSDERWLGRNILSQWSIHVAAVVVAPVISFQGVVEAAMRSRRAFRSFLANFHSNGVAICS